MGNLALGPEFYKRAKFKKVERTYRNELWSMFKVRYFAGLYGGPKTNIPEIILDLISPVPTFTQMSPNYRLN